MYRYSDTLRDQNGKPIVGALVSVVNQDGTTPTLYNDAAAQIANPVPTDEYGGFYYNVSASGFYDHTFTYGGRTVEKDRGIPVGLDPAVLADDLATLAPIAADLSTVAGDHVAIGVVSGDHTAINTVAGDHTAINTVAADHANIAAIVTNMANINAVAGNATNINAVAGNATNINTVAANQANVNAVSGSIANVNSVAGSLSTINAVAANAVNINAVAANAVNINAVATDMALGAGASYILRAPQAALDAANSAASVAASAAKIDALYAGVTPLIPAGDYVAFFGQENRDHGTDGLVSNYALPAGALAPPTAGTDFVLYGWATNGTEMSSTNYQHVFGKGAHSGTNGLWMRDRQSTLGPLTLDFGLLRSGPRNWMNNRVTSLDTAGQVDAQARFFFAFWQINDKPYFIWGPPGGPFFQTTGDGNHIVDGYFFAPAEAATSVIRTSNVTVVTRNAHGFAIGTPIRQTDASAIRFIKAVTTNTFTYDDPGTDGTLTATFSRLSTSPGDLFTTIGSAGSATTSNWSGWAGGIGPISIRGGTVNTPGSLSSWLSGGALETAKIATLSLDGYPAANLPGSDLYSHALGDLAVAPTGSRAGLGAPTLGGGGGAIVKDEPYAQPSYLKLDPWPLSWVHPTEFGKRTGTIERTFTYSGLGGTVRVLLTRSDGVLFGPVTGAVTSATDGGASTILISNVPAGNYSGKAWFANSRNDPDTPIYFANFIADVGPVYAIVTQSEGDRVLSPSYTGQAALPDSNHGRFNVVATSGGNLDANFTPAANKAIARRVRLANQAGSGLCALATVQVEHWYAALGRKISIGYVNLTTPGHSPATYWADLQTYSVTLAPIAAGGTLTGNFKPYSAPIWDNTPAYIKPGSAILLNAAGAIVATSDSSGNWVGSGFSGSITQTTPASAGAYTITSTTGGTFTLQATMSFNTASGTMSTYVSASLPVFGDTTSNSGRMANRIRVARRCTALVVPWLNAPAYGSQGLSDVDAQTYIDAQWDKLRARFQAFTMGKRARDGADVPLIMMGGNRESDAVGASEFNWYRTRMMTRDYTLRRANTYYAPACLSCELEASTGGHAANSVPGSVLVGQAYAQGIDYLEGLAGATGEEVIPATIRRISTSSIEITVSQSKVNPSATLTNTAAGEPEGVYFGTTLTNIAPIDLSLYTVSISGMKVTVSIDSGTIPSGYWNINAGYPIAATGSLAAQAARLANLLCLNTGGYGGTRPGPDVQPAPVSLYLA